MGVVLRNSLVSLIWGEAVYLGISDAFFAECNTVLIGLQRCIELQVAGIDIEVDSLSLVQIIQGTSIPPWRCIHVCRRIWQLLTQVDWTIHHIFRQSNTAADFLSKLGSTNTCISCSSISSFPPIFQNIIRQNALGLVSVRCTFFFFFLLFKKKKKTKAGCFPMCQFLPNRHSKK